MAGYEDTGAPGADEVIFLPLGGAGEIGMNLNLYGHAGRWLMVDLGITFDDGTVPGVDVIMPDPGFIEERAEDLVGIVLTHAHEDHLGAVQYLWPRLRCPVYATAFTAAVLRRKLPEAGLLDKVPLHELPLSGRIDLHPFQVELITLTHSIPEPNALIIRTKAGAVMHTGDWKLDPDPMVGPTADEKALIAAGEEGMLAMVCDSTNALSPGRSGSEGDVRAVLADVVAAQKGRVAVACFASNVARVESAAQAGVRAGREVALVGRSLWKMVDAAQETGYLKDAPRFLTDEEAAKLPPDKVLLICTGSQGEPRAALSRIARDDHQTITLDEGDTVIFSSREIPGNEVAIARLQNQLAELGCTIITARDVDDIHASGHPNRDELIQMYQWIRPKIAVPVHGEARHLLANAEIAQECQVPHTLAPMNGDVIRLAEDGATIVDEVYAGRLVLDGNRLVPSDSQAVRERRQLAWNGCVVVSLAVDRDGVLAADPDVTVFGLYDEDAPVLEDLVDVATDAVERTGRRDRREDNGLGEAVRIAVRRALQKLTGKRPPVRVIVLRV